MFRHYRELEEIGLAAPQVTYLMHDLAAAGWEVDTDATTVEEAADAITAAWQVTDLSADGSRCCSAQR